MSAAAMTSSPSTLPHSSNPLFEVSTVEARSWRVDQLEEQHRAVLAHRQVADLVHHLQRGMRQHLEAARQVARRPGLDERLDQPRERAVVHAPAGLGGGDRQADGDVRLAHARETSHILPDTRVS